MSGHDHDGMCACGKNGTPEAHGYEINVHGVRGFDGHKGDVSPLSCDDVLAIRARVAADLTWEAMTPLQRAMSWAQGRAGEYTAEAYEAAWAPPTSVPVDGAAVHADGAAR